LLYKPSVASHQEVLPSELIPAFSGYLSSQDPGYASNGIHRLFIIFGQVYFAGAIAMLMRSVVSLFHVRQLRTGGTPVAPEWHNRLSLISKSLGIRRSIDILESVRVKVPLLAGVLRPVIIVPAGMVTNLPFSQVETIMIHELSHLKRKDYLVNIIQLFIEGVLFYHPAVWIISGIVRDEREHCCDDEVLRMTDNPVNYAKALIHIAEFRQFSRLAPGAAGTGKHHLKFRINRILNIQTMKTNMRDKVISLSLVAVTVIIFLVISSFSAGPSFIRTGVMKSEMISQQDTIPQEKQVQEDEEIGEIEMGDEVEADRQEALKEVEEIDWDKVKDELEEAREEIEDIDLEEIKAEMEEARQEALKEIDEIDMERLKEELEQAREEFENMDLEKIREEVESAREEALEQIKEIDWDKLEAERQKAIREIKEIDWDEMKLELEKSVSDIEIDIDQLKADIQNSMKDIDWEAIRKDMEKSMDSLDSLRIELHH
jgi:bla regulator protein BlaR1